MLIPDVLLNHIVSDIPGSSDKISSCPYMLSPIPFLDLFKFKLKFSGRGTLDELDEFGNRQTGRDGDIDVDMVAGDATRDDFYLIGRGNLTYQFTHTKRYLSCQNWISVLREPADVILTFVNNMGCFPVSFGHTSSIPA